MKTHKISNCLNAHIGYEFFFSDHEVLVQSDYDHIQELIIDGYKEGELSHEGGRGWWKLIK